MKMFSTFMRISRRILLRMSNISNKSCRENQNTHFMFNNIFSENRAVYKIMSKNTVEPERPQTIWRRVACESIRPRPCGHPPTHTHTHTHTENYVILIAFHGNKSFVNAPQCHVACTRPVVLASRLWKKFRTKSPVSEPPTS